MNIRLGATVEVVEVASGDVANEVVAAGAETGSARPAASANGNKWRRIETLHIAYFMVAS